MAGLTGIIREEIESLYQANFPQFGDRLRSISETGEANSQAYPFKFENVGYNEVNYHFDTEEDGYIVIFELASSEQGIWDMQFGVVGGAPDDVVNQGRIFNVMSTLVNITNDFINRYKPNMMRIKPEKDEKRSTNDMRRFNLYLAYIKKNIKQRPEYYAFEYGDYIIIERRTKVKPTSNV